MRISLRYPTFLCVIFCALFLLSCGSPKGAQPGDACSNNEDCQSEEQELECRAKKCRTLVENKAPTAEIKASPERGAIGQLIRLDGNRSDDPEGDTLSFAWTLKEKPENSKAELKNADKDKAEFEADEPGDYVVELVVTDSSDKKNKSKPASVTISIRDVPNTKPIANAGEDQIVGPNSQVKLDGGKSLDPEQQELTYAWSFKITPDGSSAKLDGADSKTPSFTADNVGKYVIELVVTDSRGEASSPDSITVVSMVGFDKTPAVSSISPKEGLLGEKVKATISGSDFVDGAEVRIGSKTLKATYQSETSLEVELDLNGLTPREYEVFVINPNGKASRPPGKFTIRGIPEPKLKELKPAFSFVKVKSKIRAIGDNFFEGSEVLFQSVPLKTTYVSKNELEFELDLKETPEGKYAIKVRNNPGNLLSNELQFTVLGSRPKAILRVLNPPFAPEDSSIDFSVHGQGFERGAKIIFDGVELKTKYIRRDELQVDGKLDLKAINKKAGVYDVWVRNPDGQNSNKEKFRVRSPDPTPQLARILPFSLFLDEEMKAVAIYGQEFLKGAKLLLDGKEIGPKAGPHGQLTWKSNTYLEARVDLRDSSKWTAGDVEAQIVNPNGKKSNKFRLTISYRIPTVNSLVPSAWTTKCDTDVEVYGLNFVPKAQILFGSKVYTATSTTNKLTFVSEKLLKFRLPATKMTAKTYDVIVQNGTNAKSSKVAFKVDNAASLTPYPRYISPSVGAADTQITVQVVPESGSSRYQSFKPGSVVLFNGKPQKTACTSFGSGTYCYRLEATLDLEGVKPGNYDLFVANPCNVRSAPMNFTVLSAPKPYILAFEPAYAKTGDKIKLKLKGNHFTKNHQVLIDSRPIKSTFSSEKEIVLDLLDLTNVAPRTYTISVKNANGNTTGNVKFSVISPFSPVITEVKNNVQSAGRTATGFTIKGSGFVLTSRVYIDGKLATARFASPTEILVSSFDATKLAVGTYNIQVRNGSRGSNYFPMVLIPIPGPQIDYIDPATQIAGSTNKFRLRVTGRRFSTSPRPTLIIKSPKGQDLSSRFTLTSTFPSATYMYGDFDISGLGAGKYPIQIKNGTGELSNQVFFTLAPPPPPVVTGVNPPFVFRGVANQIVQVIGSNFVTGDLVIFNGNTLGPIPGTAKSNSALEFALDTRRYNAARDYEVYVKRCLDAGCSKFQVTQKVKLTMKDPPCSALPSGCAASLLPNGREGCDTAGGNVCRPKCSLTSACKVYDPKATWTCQGGFCK